MSTISVSRSPDEPDDERRLYGDPQHEVGADSDPEQLYGTPQHESGGVRSKGTDLWLDCIAFRKSGEEQYE